MVSEEKWKMSCWSHISQGSQVCGFRRQWVSCKVTYDIAKELPPLKCSKWWLWRWWFPSVIWGLGHDLWNLIHSHHIKVLQFQVGTIFETTFLSILKCLQELRWNPWHSIFAGQTLSLTANILGTKLYENIVLKITKFANVKPNCHGFDNANDPILFKGKFLKDS